MAGATTVAVASPTCAAGAQQGPLGFLEHRKYIRPTARRLYAVRQEATLRASRK